jgi:thymidylate synthase ThyX
MKNAIILADSLNTATGDRLTTFLLPRFPKCLLAELNTHRIFSRSAASSRAIPVRKMIERIIEDPYFPSFRKNKRGMQGESLRESVKIKAERFWNIAMSEAIECAIELDELGIHKDMANRLLEPFMRVPVVVSSTEWENFFDLRCSPMAAPDFEEVAREMEKSRLTNIPWHLEPGQWHIPFKPEDENELLRQLERSAACAARTSYANHDGTEPNYEKDKALHDMLLKEKHMSPFEHQAVAMRESEFCKNFRGFRQYRDFIEKGEEI